MKEGDVPELEIPQLDGRRVSLVAVTAEHYPFLQLVETSSELAPRWRHRGATPSPEQWSHALWAGVLAQFIVMPLQEDRPPVGIACATQANFQDGHAQLATTAFDPTRPSPLVYEGFAVFLDYVFACWNLRKLYMEVPEHGYLSIASGADRFFEVEGRLRDHSFLAGELWDQLILAIDREAWGEHGSALLHGRGTATTAAGRWEAFGAELADLGQCAVDGIERESSLVQDLGLDSLALAELTARLVDDYDVVRLAEQAADIRWEDLTAGTLFDEYVDATVG